MAYETKQAILVEAGLSFSVRSEGLSGAIDGSNTVFTTAHAPLSDTNYDDVISVADVVVYVDGVPVTVAAVDATHGIITLQTAPLVSASEITADYRHCPVDDIELEKVRIEAQDHINEVMADVDPTPYTTVPTTVRKMVRYYAAGMLLVRNYGSATGEDGTSKDGYKKMAMVDGDGKNPGWLARFLELGGVTGGGSAEPTEAEVIGDDPLFSTSSNYVRPYGLDDVFMRDAHEDW